VLGNEIGVNSVLVIFGVPEKKVSYSIFSQDLWNLLRCVAGRPQRILPKADAQGRRVQ